MPTQGNCQGGYSEVCPGKARFWWWRVRSSWELGQCLEKSLRMDMGNLSCLQRALDRWEKVFPFIPLLLCQAWKLGECGVGDWSRRRSDGLLVKNQAQQSCEISGGVLTWLMWKQAWRGNSTGGSGLEATVSQEGQCFPPISRSCRRPHATSNNPYNTARKICLLQFYRWGNKLGKVNLSNLSSRGSG